MCNQSLHSPFVFAATARLFIKVFPDTAAASASDLLAHVEARFGRRGGIFPHLTGEAFGAVTALEDLKAMSAFLSLFGAHLALPQHWFAYLGPEVPGTAVSVRAVGRAQAGVALVTCHKEAQVLIAQALRAPWGETSKIICSQGELRNA